MQPPPEEPGRRDVWDARERARTEQRAADASARKGGKAGKGGKGKGGKAGKGGTNGKKGGARR